MPKQFFIVLVFLFHYNLCAASSVPESYTILNNLGFSLEDTPAIDFSLALVNGQEKKLSEYKGKWIWLAFWATWCGPCVYEMPQLENLKKSIPDSKFAILGVNVDNGKTPQEIERFLQSKGITFPNFLDTTSQATRDYAASALPTLYVINPDFKIVGKFQGANNWEGEEVKAQVKSLLTSTQMGKIPEKPKVPALPAPTLKLFVDEEDPRMICVQVKWTASAYMYQLKVPELILPPNVTHGDIQTESYSQGKENVLLYKYPLKFAKGGIFEIGPAEQQFLSADKPDQPQYARTNSIKMVIPIPIYQQSIFYPSLVILLICIVGGVYFYKKSSKEKQQSNKILQDIKERKDSKDKLNKKFQEVLTLEYKGEYANYVVALLHLEHEVEVFLKTWDDEKNQKKELLITQIKYANQLPQQTQVDSKKNKLAYYFSKESLEDE